MSSREISEMTRGLVIVLVFFCLPLLGILETLVFRMREALKQAGLSKKDIEELTREGETKMGLR